MSSVIRILLSTPCSSRNTYINTRQIQNRKCVQKQGLGLDLSSYTNWSISAGNKSTTSLRCFMVQKIWKIWELSFNCLIITSKQHSVPWSVLERGNWLLIGGGLGRADITKHFLCETAIIQLIQRTTGNIYYMFHCIIHQSIFYQEYFV